MRNRKQKRNSRLTLDEQLSSIGLMILTRSLSPSEIESVDIEESLANAFVCLNEPGNQRLLSLLLSWMSIHGKSVILEKLLKILSRKQAEGDAVHFATLVARFAERNGIKRWKILSNFAPKGVVIVGPVDLAQSLVNLRGEEDWSTDSGFIVPKGTVTIDSKWVLARDSLAAINRQYRNRLIYGAQWRADIVTAIELGAKTPTDISRMCGASYEPCHRVMSELKDAGLFRDRDKQRRRVI